VGDLDYRLIHGSLDPRYSLPPKQAHDRFSRFTQLTHVVPSTDTQTPLRAATSVAIGRICAMRTMQREMIHVTMTTPLSGTVCHPSSSRNYHYQHTPQI